jgi:hypothetical protein
MREVRIDHRTVVIAKPGEDPEEVRRKYHENLTRKHIAPTQRK